MTRRLNIGKFNLDFVFRHKWDNPAEIGYSSTFRDYNLGLWFKKGRILVEKYYTKPLEWTNKFVNDYMIGINLIVCKTWISFNIGGANFKLPKIK